LKKILISLLMMTLSLPLLRYKFSQLEQVKSHTIDLTGTRHIKNGALEHSQSALAKKQVADRGYQQQISGRGRARYVQENRGYHCH
jgi:hypothetical protein